MKALYYGVQVEHFMHGEGIAASGYQNCDVVSPRRVAHRELVNDAFELKQSSNFARSN